MKNIKTLLILLILVVIGKSTPSGEKIFRDLIISNQNKLCKYESIELTETINGNLFKARENFNIIALASNQDTLMLGATKFPFIDESAWLFVRQNDSLMSSITSNNSKVDRYLQEIEIVAEPNRIAISKLKGRIYKELALMEKDCKYDVYIASYDTVNGISLPVEVNYYKNDDTLFQSPIFTSKNSYIFGKLKKEDDDKCWEISLNCDNFLISNDTSLLKSFFEKREFKEKNCFITGEMLQHQKNYEHVGASLDSNIKVTYSMLKDYSSSRIWKASLRDKDEKGTDYYVEIKSEKLNVKLERIRAFNLPGMYYMIIDSLERKMELSDEEARMIVDVKLWLSTDDQLKEYFQKHRKDFNKLDKEIDKIGEWNRFLSSAENENKKIKGIMDRLHLNSIYKENGFEKIKIFNLGGWIDNEVGFIRAKNHQDLPEIFRSRFILIEEITEGWFIYKTT